MKLPLAKEGWPFIIGLVLVGIVLAQYSPTAAVPIWVILAFVINFFRDPSRLSRETDAAILAPADGQIISIIDSDIPDVYPDHKKISVFMNVFSVHVNRAPMSGEITEMTHFPGKFRPAWEDAASHGNERTEIHMTTDIGRVMVRLVAGLVARRIKPYIRASQTVERGERISIIKFGSRVDIYLPRTVRVEVNMGDRVKAGITRIATKANGVKENT